jgi:hypothetical protein
MNDRQRVEALFFPMLFKSILESGGKRDEGFQQCVTAIDAASAEILRPLDLKRRASIMRRTYRTHDGAMQPDREGGVTVEKTTLVGYHLLQAVLASGFLELEEGAPLAAAISAIVNAFADSFNEHRLDASARKQAAKMLRQLQDGGFFEGVEMQREAA